MLPFPAIADFLGLGFLSAGSTDTTGIDQVILEQLISLNQRLLGEGSSNTADIDQILLEQLITNTSLANLFRTPANRNIFTILV